VLAAEVQHETPHPAAIPLLMKWGATALHTSAVRPYASDSALALVEDVMRRATDRVCPTRRAAARRARRVVELKLLSQPKKDGSEGEDNVEVEGDGYEVDVEGEDEVEDEVKVEGEGEGEGDEDELPCIHMYFAARARKGNHLPCAQALVRAKCCPHTLYIDGGRARNSLSTAIMNPNKHAALIVRFLHAECGVTCAVERHAL